MKEIVRFIDSRFELDGNNASCFGRNCACSATESPSRHWVMFADRAGRPTHLFQRPWPPALAWLASLVEGRRAVVVLLDGDLFAGHDRTAEIQCHRSPLFTPLAKTTVSPLSLATVTGRKSTCRRHQQRQPAIPWNERASPPPEPLADRAGSTRRSLHVHARHQGEIRIRDVNFRLLGAGLRIDAHCRPSDFALEIFARDIDHW